MLVQGTTYEGMTGLDAFRLTQYARGGSCAYKIPPGELEETVASLKPDGPGADLLVGVEHGDDGAVVRVSPAMAVVVTPTSSPGRGRRVHVRPDRRDQRLDICAMGGVPLVAVNLLG